MDRLTRCVLGLRVGSACWGIVIGNVISQHAGEKIQTVCVTSWSDC